MLYRKTDFTFWGVTLFKWALKYIALTKIKNILVHYEDNALVIVSTKIRFQLPSLNIPLGKSHIGVWELIYALHLRCEKFLSGLQGNIVSNYI